jgi:hypothetical protein
VVEYWRVVDSWSSEAWRNAIATPPLEHLAVRSLRWGTPSYSCELGGRETDQFVEIIREPQNRLTLIGPKNGYWLGVMNGSATQFARSRGLGTVERTQPPCGPRIFGSSHHIHHSDTPILHHSSTPVLQHSTAPPLRRSVAETLRYFRSLVMD